MAPRAELQALFPGAICTPVVEGENETWKVERPDRTLAVRRYRPGRRTLAEIEAE